MGGARVGKPCREAAWGEKKFVASAAESKKNGARRLGSEKNRATRVAN
jgi:hypothetical protein